MWHRILIGSLTLIFLVLTISRAQAQEGRGSEYNIAPAPLEQALADFVAQSGVQLFYLPALVTGKQSAGARGHLAPQQALDRLLAGTSLVATHVRNDVYVIRDSRSQQKKAQQNVTPSPSNSNLATTELQGVLVTGSRLLHAAADVTSAPLTIISREEIESRGAVTLFDLLRNQSGLIGHAAVEISMGRRSQTLTSLAPSTIANSASLFPFGPRGTLYLIDGRRLQTYSLPSENIGGFVDLTTIPLSSIERIEILRGGASAIYGADAIVGVVNIITRKDREGSELSVVYGISQRGDAAYWRTSARSGISLDDSFLSLSIDRLHQSQLSGSSRAWHTLNHRRRGLPDATELLGYWTPEMLVPNSQCIRAQNPSDPTCRLDTERHKSLLPELDSTSVQLHWRSLGSGAVSPYFDLRSTRIRSHIDSTPHTIVTTDFPPSDPYFEKNAQAYYAFYDVGPIKGNNESTNLGAALGLNYGIGPWTINTEVQYRSDRVSNENSNIVDLNKLKRAIENDKYYYDGRINNYYAIRQISRNLSTSASSQAMTASIQANSEFEAWNNGKFKISLGMEHETSNIRYRYDPYFLDPIYPYPFRISSAKASSRRHALFAEIEVPITPKIFLESAGRIDWVDTAGNEVSPRLGTRWSVSDSMVVRANFSKSFRAPTLLELYGYPPNEPTGYLLVPNTSPAAPCAYGTMQQECLLIVGLTTNHHLKPEYGVTKNIGAIWSNSRNSISIDYFDIERSNEISAADPAHNSKHLLDGLIRNSSGESERIDIKYVNDGTTKVRGFYVNAIWSPIVYAKSDRSEDRLVISFSGNYIDQIKFHRDERKPINQAGYLSPRLTANAGIRWRNGNWVYSAQANYFSNYRVHPKDEPCPIENMISRKCKNRPISFMSLDVQYRSRDEKWSFGAGINNVMDRQPSNYERARSGYNPSFDDPIGRSFQIRVTRNFD